ncbi:hypothetical protein QTP88_005264 [Uroleucon formosanum]
MTDTVAATPAPVAASPAAKKSPAKKKLSASKVKKTVALHPTTAVMVTSAIKELKEKKGSSLPAIKKYLAANYKVDPAKLAPFIRKFLKAAVANGTVVQTKGTGASGHFKLPVAEVKPKKKAVVAKKKKSIVKKVKTPGTPKKKKLTTAKKPAAGEPAAKKAKKSAATKPKATTPKKAPAKVKKPAAVKPKPKKTPIKKTAAPKKNSLSYGTKRRRMVNELLALESSDDDNVLNTQTIATTSSISNSTVSSHINFDNNLNISQQILLNIPFNEQNLKDSTESIPITFEGDYQQNCVCFPYLPNGSTLRTHDDYVAMKYEECHTYDSTSCISPIPNVDVVQLFSMDYMHMKIWPLDNSSTFPFENYMKDLKRMLCKHDKPLQQVVKRYEEQCKNIKNDNPKNKDILNLTAKTPDCFALTKQGEVIQLD